MKISTDTLTYAGNGTYGAWVRLDLHLNPDQMPSSLLVNDPKTGSTVEYTYTGNHTDEGKVVCWSYRSEEGKYLIVVQD